MTMTTKMNDASPSGAAPLKVERQETYARNRAQGLPAAKAAIAAGFAAGSGTTTKLEHDEEVQARIEFLRTQIAEERAQRKIANAEAARIVGETTGFSRAWVLQQLAENAAHATQDGEYKAATDALKLIGEELGMFQGGSDPGRQQGDVPRVVDADMLGALQKGWTALQDKTEPEDAMSDEEKARVAASIIEGNIPSNKVNPKDRELRTGTEVDAALEIDDEDDEDDA